jgi:uncharacterized protein YjdB
MGTHSFWRGGRLRIPVALFAVVLAGMATLTVNALPASALGNPVLLTITVSPTAVSVAAGDTEQFSATGHYSDLSTKNLTDGVTWSTSSSSTATISNIPGSQGLATALSTGVTTVTATDGSIFGVAALTVLPAVLIAVTVSPSVTSIPLGETAPFNATGHYSDGSTQNLTKTVTWATSSATVATVSNASGSQGQVTATGTGLATIMATDSSASLSGTAAVTVLPAALLAITVSPTATNLPAGETAPFTATGLYSNATTENITDSVTWSSSDTSDATVSNAPGSQGEVTAVATGASTIAATDPTTSIQGTALVTVLPAVLVAITVSPLAGNLPAGETEQFSSTGLYSDGTTADITDSVTWSSSDTSAATISNTAGSQGLVTGVADGASTITATDPTTSIEGVAAVTVLPAVLVAISVSPLEASVALNATQQFTATGYYSDSSTQDLTDSVTWSSSDVGEASISNIAGSQGLATGLATGAVVITATDPSSAIAGIAALDVTGPAISLSTSAGAPKTHLVVEGQGFTPGQKIVVNYVTGVSTEPRYLICKAVVTSNGTFSCAGRIRNSAKSGAPGLHKVNAKVRHVHGVIASTGFTLT